MHRDDATEHAGRARRVGRRPVLRATLSTVGIAAVAGCIGGQAADPEPTEAPPEPIDLSGGKTDDMGGMIIGEHFGPNGQIFYKENSPEGHDNPAWFHTLVSTLFPYYFEKRKLGWEVAAFYVTDYSVVDYDLETIDEKTYISSHTNTGTFGDAMAMTYVHGSEVLGGMGKALVPFSDGGDAADFASEHGGDTMSFDEITPEFIADYIR